MNNTSDLSNLVTLNRTPSYLKYLLGEEKDIIFVHGSKKSTSSNSEGQNASSVSSADQDLDLTGNPLDVNLSLDDAISFEDVAVTWWTSEESKYIPINLTVARKFLNNKLKNLLQNSENKPANYFCLLNGNDRSRTVLLGCFYSKKLVSQILVHNLSYFSQNDSIMSTKSMERKHHLNTGKLQIEKTEVKVSGLYSLFDSNFLNINPNIENKETTQIGSILIDAKWKQFVLDIPSDAEIQLKLKLQTGHFLSPLLPFWQDIQMLHNLLDKRLKNNFSSLTSEIPSHIDYKSFSEISNEIISILNNNVLKKTSPSVDKNKSLTLHDFVINFNKIKFETFLDKLWKILIKCKNVRDLKDTFSLLFEEITQNNTNHLYIPDDDLTNLANIINGLANGKITVPNINEVQALELLIEFGIEKLKKDYFYIVNYFSYLPKSSILEKWGENIATKKEAKAEQHKTSLRKTLNYLRASESQTSSTYLNKQFLNLIKLAQLHVSLEYVHMIEQYCVFNGPTILYIVCKKIFDKCFSSESPIKFVKNNHPCEVSLPIKYSDIQLSKKNTLMFRVEMTSRSKYSDVSTVFLVSSGPVLPPTVCDNGENENIIDSNPFSALEMMTRTYRYY